MSTTLTPGTASITWTSSPDHDRPLLAARQRRDLGLAAHLLQRVVELLYLVERQDLVLVGEQDVDVLLDELEELGAIAATQNESDSVKATLTPAQLAAMAALRMASLARG